MIDSLTAAAGKFLGVFLLRLALQLRVYLTRDRVGAKRTPKQKDMRFWPGRRATGHKIRTDFSRVPEDNVSGKALR